MIPTFLRSKRNRNQWFMLGTIYAYIFILDLHQNVKPGIILHFSFISFISLNPFDLYFRTFSFTLLLILLLLTLILFRAR